MGSFSLITFLITKTFLSRSRKKFNLQLTLLIYNSCCPYYLSHYSKKREGEKFVYLSSDNVLRAAGLYYFEADLLSFHHVALPSFPGNPLEYHRDDEARASGESQPLRPCFKAPVFRILVSVKMTKYLCLSSPSPGSHGRRCAGGLTPDHTDAAGARVLTAAPTGRACSSCCCSAVPVQPLGLPQLPCARYN